MRHALVLRSVFIVVFRYTWRRRQRLSTKRCQFLHSWMHRYLYSGQGGLWSFGLWNRVGLHAGWKASILKTLVIAYSTNYIATQRGRPRLTFSPLWEPRVSIRIKRPNDVCSTHTWNVGLLVPVDKFCLIRRFIPEGCLLSTTVGVLMYTPWLSSHTIDNTMPHADPRPNKTAN
jgi:hypothetical protein